MCLHFHIKDAQDPPLMWPCYLFHCCPLIGFSRASISRDPFYDMLATRKRRIANKKWRRTILSMHNLQSPSIFILHTVNQTVQKPVLHRNDCQPQNRLSSWRWTYTELSASHVCFLERHHSPLRGQQIQKSQICGLLWSSSQFVSPPSHTHPLPLPVMLITCF